MRPSDFGQSIILYEKTQTGVDSMNMPVYSEQAVTVDNVFIGKPSGEEIANELTLTGKRWEHTLGIPKGDTHNWEDVVVEFMGRKWHTFGAPVSGIPDLMPYVWGTNVKVEAYE